MNKGLLVLNGLLLVLVGVLFYLHFSAKNTPAIKETRKQPVSSASPAFKIAYFEMDSLENSFAMVKDVSADLNRKKNNMEEEISSKDKAIRNRIAQYQSQGATMSQVQSELAQRDVQQMQVDFENLRKKLNEDYQEVYLRKWKDVKNIVENFLVEYNKGKGYSYIFAYEPGLFYYRDTAYNITADVLAGLNSQYKKKK